MYKYLWIPLVFLLTGCSFIPDMQEPSPPLEIRDITLPREESSATYGEIISELIADGAKGEALLDLLYWQGINPEVSAMLSIESLEIYEPVLSPSVDNQQWLRTNIFGEEDTAGCIFADYRCDISSHAIKLIHGHNMKNDTMFGKIPDLMRLEDCSAMPVVTLITEDGQRDYEIFAVVSVDALKETLPLNALFTSEDVKEIAGDLLSRSVVPGGSVHSDDLLVLNTCWYGLSGQERNLHCIVAASRVR